MPNDPYASTIRTTGFQTPNFSLPPIGANQGPGNASLEAYQYSPEELERMIAAGWKVFEDGSMAPPEVFTSPPPSMGAMTGAANAGQIAAPAWQPGSGTSPLQPPPPPGAFDDPIFSAYNAIANPAPKERDPLKRMMRDPNAEKPGPREGMNVSVPGGASIQNGMPMAAPPPLPPANVRTTNTYNVQMAPSEESAGRLLQTEMVRGQNKQAQRDYDEMARSRKVQTLRGFMGGRR